MALTLVCRAARRARAGVCAREGGAVSGRARAGVRARRVGGGGLRARWGWRRRWSPSRIDAGDSTAFAAEVMFDVAGLARFVDDPATVDTGVAGGGGVVPARAVVDMGAHEFQAGSPPPPACPCDADGDGAVTARDVVVWLGLFFARDAAADVNGDGRVDVVDVLEFVDCFAGAVGGGGC